MIRRSPERVIDWIIHHRLEREAKVVAALRANPHLTTRELVPHVYRDVDRKLYGWAQRSLLAHLIKLEEDGVAVRNRRSLVAWLIHGPATRPFYEVRNALLRSMRDGWWA